MADIFRNIFRGLKPNGRFAFSTESLDISDIHDPIATYQLTPGSRYAHADSYVRALAVETGFSIAAYENIELRLERGAPVNGCLYVLQKSGAEIRS